VSARRRTAGHGADVLSLDGSRKVGRRRERLEGREESRGRALGAGEGDGLHDGKRGLSRRALSR
jgi:hypothetical protein